MIAISVADFARHVREMHRDSNQSFEKEYKSIKDGKHSWEASQLPYNKVKKNRFTNIFPCEYLEFECIAGMGDQSFPHNRQMIIVE